MFLSSVWNTHFAIAFFRNSSQLCWSLYSVFCVLAQFLTMFALLALVIAISVLSRILGILVGLYLLWPIVLGDAFATTARDNYEERLVKIAMQRRGLKRDPAPDGKIIADIVIERENMIGSIDPWPQWINWIHVKTREQVIRREVLVAVGERWHSEKIAETERNLRSLAILASVSAVACLGKRPDQVILLIVTKDVWSLRLSTDFNQVGLVLTTLGFFPTEYNFLGRNKQLGLQFGLSQLDLARFTVNDRFTLGQFYYDPRLAGTRLQLLEWAGIFIDGHTPCAGAIGQRGDLWCPQTSPGQVRGFFAQISLVRPLYALSAQWSFAFDARILIDQHRSFRQNPDDQPPPLGERHGLSISTVRFEHPDGLLRSIPRVYDRFELLLSASYTRSFGTRIKHDLTAGWGLYRYLYTPPDNFPFDAWLLSLFEKFVMPRSESASYLWLMYRIRPTTFHRLRNINSYGFSEDFALGLDFSVRISPALDIVHLSQLFLAFQLSASYRYLLFNHLIFFSMDAYARWQPRSNEIALPGPWLNLRWATTINYISPLLSFGRVHAQVLMQLRHHNIEQHLSYLGSAQALRGYLSGQFAGENLIRFNVEFRSLPLVFFTIHLGFVAFYDGGGLWAGSDPFQPSRELPFIYRQSLGLGLRLLIPQFSKGVMRLDVGFPLTAEPGPFVNWLSLSYNQAF